MGTLLRHPRLGSLVPLPVRLLPAELLSSEYYQSSDDLYYRYPQEMRVPVYNKQWHNMYPEGALYHRGHHFLIDTF